MSEAARESILSPENTIYYSTASLWEIAIKNQKAPDRCPYNEKDVERFCEKAGFLLMSIRNEYVTGLRELKVRPGRCLSNYDPFDRILLSQARAEGCRLMTHDVNMANYQEDCIFVI